MFLETFDELSELIELNPKNHINFCNMGGMISLLELIMVHKNDKVRHASCRTLVSITSNNNETQNFANKAGAVNLAVQLEREKKPFMREAIIGCVSSHLKAANFAGKIEYITELDGLAQLSRWYTTPSEEEKALFGTGALPRKIRLKLLQLIYDFVNNDDSIINDGYHVRRVYGADKKLIARILDAIKNFNIESNQELQLREHTLTTLYRIY